MKVCSCTVSNKYRTNKQYNAQTRKNWLWAARLRAPGNPGFPVFLGNQQEFTGRLAAFHVGMGTGDVGQRVDAAKTA
ncbi:hypothetical protein GCM10007868_18430 [Gluconobacter frateurii]|uniref:Uncharacterized protein n=1 Tax=Gluconobacter frateurii NRIC 0228 TaxID=1307946 RepID=A0ABQ0QFJ5_9PROT|nr:hypothetical protein AA0228_2968 [Gluconobacter frateurii NRIC 0228]GLP90768.1 hypothetical protein GCM10007868_18430 [Gluconobacter frateurii]